MVPKPFVGLYKLNFVRKKILIVPTVQSLLLPSTVGNPGIKGSARAGEVPKEHDFVEKNDHVCFFRKSFNKEALSHQIIKKGSSCTIKAIVIDWTIILFLKKTRWCVLIFKAVTKNKGVSKKSYWPFTIINKVRGCPATDIIELVFNATKAALCWTLL